MNLEKIGKFLRMLREEKKMESGGVCRKIIHWPIFSKQVGKGNGYSFFI